MTYFLLKKKLERKELLQLDKERICKPVASIILNSERVNAFSFMFRNKTKIYAITTFIVVEYC